MSKAAPAAGGLEALCNLSNAAQNQKCPTDVTHSTGSGSLNGNVSQVTDATLVELKEEMDHAEDELD